METYIPISYLNDFIFCPRSIYFHQLYGRASTRLYHTNDQAKGLAAHKTIDNQVYSTAKTVLQGLEVFSEYYNLCGKIDLYYAKTQELVERKKKIKVIYPGYIFQLYAQYFGLVEMGYPVKKLKLYSMDDNKNYPVSLPEEDPKQLQNFEGLIKEINQFSLSNEFTPNANKCQHCIYRNLCDQSLC